MYFTLVPVKWQTLGWAQHEPSTIKHGYPIWSAQLWPTNKTCAWRLSFVRLRCSWVFFSTSLPHQTLWVQVSQLINFIVFYIIFPWNPLVYPKCSWPCLHIPYASFDGLLWLIFIATRPLNKGLSIWEKWSVWMVSQVPTDSWKTITLLILPTSG